MAVFQPREIFRVLGEHGVKYVVIGNLGGTLYGSPLVTTDVDLCPSRDERNLVALAAALGEMNARIRTPDAPEGILFTCDATFLRQMTMVNLTTRFGDVDLAFGALGQAGRWCSSGAPFRTTCETGSRPVSASLEDIIRSKEAAKPRKGPVGPPDAASTPPDDQGTGEPA